MGLCEWITEKKETIKIVSDIVSIIVSCTAIILFGITIYQVSKAANTLKASTIYAIAKDGRELRQKMNEMVKEKTFNYGYIFNYVHSVWHQKRLGTLDERLWAPIENEICLFLADNPKSMSYWKEKQKTLFDPMFVELIFEISKRPKCQTKKGGG